MKYQNKKKTSPSCYKLFTPFSSTLLHNHSPTNNLPAKAQPVIFAREIPHSPILTVHSFALPAARVCTTCKKPQSRDARSLHPPPRFNYTFCRGKGRAVFFLFSSSSFYAARVLSRVNPLTRARASLRAWAASAILREKRRRGDDCCAVTMMRFRELEG